MPRTREEIIASIALAKAKMSQDVANEKLSNSTRTLLKLTQELGSLTLMGRHNSVIEKVTNALNKDGLKDVKGAHLTLAFHRCIALITVGREKEAREDFTTLKKKAVASPDMRARLCVLHRVFSPESEYVKFKKEVFRVFLSVDKRENMVPSAAVRLHEKLGEFASHIGRIDWAEEYFAQAVEECGKKRSDFDDISIRPLYFKLLDIRARQHELKEEWDEAEALYKEVSDEFRQNHGLFSVAMVAYQRNELHCAAQQFLEILNRTPDDISALYNLAMIRKVLAKRGYFLSDHGDEESILSDQERAIEKVGAEYAQVLAMLPDNTGLNINVDSFRCMAANNMTCGFYDDGKPKLAEDGFRINAITYPNDVAAKHNSVVVQLLESESVSAKQLTTSAKQLALCAEENERVAEFAYHAAILYFEQASYEASRNFYWQAMKNNSRFTREYGLTMWIELIGLIDTIFPKHGCLFGEKLSTFLLSMLLLPLSNSYFERLWLMTSMLYQDQSFYEYTESICFVFLQWTLLEWGLGFVNLSPRDLTDSWQAAAHQRDSSPEEVFKSKIQTIKTTGKKKKSSLVCVPKSDIHSTKERLLLMAKVLTREDVYETTLSDFVPDGSIEVLKFSRMSELFLYEYPAVVRVPRPERHATRFQDTHPNSLGGPISQMKLFVPARQIVKKDKLASVDVAKGGDESREPVQVASAEALSPAMGKT